MAQRGVDEVRRAIAEAGIGGDELFADLMTLDAIGDLALDGSTAELTVSLPIPDEGLRARLEAEVRDALDAVDGIEAVRIGFEPAVADQRDRVDLLPTVKNVIAVSSGKGGVGKSTVAANLAASLADCGVSVGLLDADIYGPNAPALLGAPEGTPATTSDARIVPREAHGVQVMSMDFIVDEDDPIIWRGPMVDDVLHQLTGDVDWGELDYLIVDLPPGTGDAQLTLVQHLPVTGAVIVTTPQAVAVDDARRGLEGFAKYGVPILGVVENMHTFVCPDCGGDHPIFGSGGADDLAEAFDIPVLGRLPLDPSVGTLEADDAEPTGIDVPVLGRLAVPRTREERADRLPPSALRAEGPVRTGMREMATRVSARCQLAVVRADED